jgi:hypothetical protein
MLAMIEYPETQRLAQEELDRVVGRGRLPTFSDRASLPYINAMVMFDFPVIQPSLYFIAYKNR